MKPALDPLEVANKTVRTIVSLDSVPYRYVTRTGRMNQGTAEIPAFYLEPCDCIVNLRPLVALYQTKYASRYAKASSYRAKYSV